MNRREFLSKLKIVFSNSSLIRKRALGVLRIYDALDRHINRLKARTGLQCVAGCGRCCENPRVEVSVLEAMPLAAALWTEGRGEEALKILEDSKGKECVFFKRDPLISGKGSCSVYPFRPLICRLYGFAANRDKKQNPIFVGCPMIREEFPKEYEAAEQLADQKSAEIPSMSDYGAQISAVDPKLARESLPINEAVKEALVKAGLLVKLKNDL